LNALTLQRRSLAYHWRAHLSVVLSVVVGTATLTGALLVGDALRGSLRAAALDRLGRIDYAVQAPHYFRQHLADELAASAVSQPGWPQVAPAILAQASATAADTHATVHSVSLLGVDGRFWALADTPSAAPVLDDQHVLLNRALADELHARSGDDMLLRVARPAVISPETLLGRRDNAPVTLRLTVGAIVPAEGLGAFTLRPRQTLPRNAFVSLAVLQRVLEQRGRVNTLLLESSAGGRAATPADAVRDKVTLDDLGLRLRVSDEQAYVALESDAFLLPPPTEAAGRAAADALRCSTTGVLAYLANTIAVEGRPERVIPYSTVAAISAPGERLEGMTLVTGQPAPVPEHGAILLNEWAARDLGAQAGDVIRLSYYVAGAVGRLDTQTATFRLRGVVRIAGAAADPWLAPEYPGVTDADSLADWRPPFPIDPRLVRPTDEEYWKQHRATPKALVALEDGERLWAGDAERFGRLTALRVHVPEGERAAELRAALERELRSRLDVRQLGWSFDAARARALDASEGATDFAGLFVGFSLFLIVSAALLVALFFGLNVERRAHEIGILLASGFTRRRVAGWLLAEGALLAFVGGVVGLAGARGYAGLMLAGLRTWWAPALAASDPTGGGWATSALRLHSTPTSYLIGFVGGGGVALVSIAWSLRGLTRIPARALLAGVVQSGQPRPARRDRGSLLVAALAGATAFGLLAASLLTARVPQTGAFFGGGALLLVAALAGLAHWLRRQPHRTNHPRGRGALIRLGVRNARRHVGRSMLTAGLIAAATFVIVALEALRLDASRADLARDSGTGGFALLAEATVPLPYDLNSADGRRKLGVSVAAEQSVAGVQFVPLRVRGGDEASCLNLYRPTEPRLLGAGDALIERGGFAFAAALATTDAERHNPWTLLRRSLPDQAVPAIADEAAAHWQLHLNLGDEVRLTDERGRDVRLRLVALLRGSFLQGELIVAEPQFTRLFPSIAGHAYFLIDAPAGRAAEVERTLERELADYGLAVTPTTRRLGELHAIQNTYLSTFQTLGGFGLLLGTVGLAAALLRSIWERRAELALLRTLGFSRAALGTLVLAENAFLVAIGLASGLLAAAVAVAPHAALRAAPVPWAALLLMPAGIFAAGLLAGVVALVPALRAPLLPALRSE
jgi:ABC-type lipoprotein release transport system permease subunit